MCRQKFFMLGMLCLLVIWGAIRCGGYPGLPCMNGYRFVLKSLEQVFSSSDFKFEFTLYSSHEEKQYCEFFMRSSNPVITQENKECFITMRFDSGNEFIFDMKTNPQEIQLHILKNGISVFRQQWMPAYKKPFYYSGNNDNCKFSQSILEIRM